MAGHWKSINYERKHMEIAVGIEWLELYADSIGLAIQVPTWLAVGTVGLTYSIRLLRRD
jgi:hypothetical protein